MKKLIRFCAGGVSALMALSSLSMAASPINSIEVVGTEFRVTRADGTVLGSESLVGAVLTIADAEGRPISVRIEDATRDPADPEIVLHTFSLRDPASGRWSNPCEPDPQGVQKGFPMRGTLAEDGEYRPDAPGFSITCTLGVQAKCVRWGYKPWKAAPAGASMLDLYRSCMRMARADYCGDGKAHTRNGTDIDLYDRVGIQRPEPASTMTFEAAWGPQGAICMKRTRIPAHGSLEDVVRRCPRLASMPATCGEDTPGALLFNKSY